MLKKRMNNKGAVEMSLNLIIMLVIGLTVMGLIIAFVTNFLGDAGAGIGEVTPGDEEKLASVLEEPGNFEFYARDLTIQRGDTKKLYVKFENPFTSSVTILSGGQVISDDSDNLYYTISGGPNPSDTSPEYSEIQVVAPPISLQPSGSNSYPFTVEVADSGVPTGNYFLEFKTSYDDGTDTKNYTKVVTLTVE